jgi:hypothetical protein
MSDAQDRKECKNTSKFLAITAIQFRESGQYQCDGHMLQQIAVNSRGDQERVVGVAIWLFDRSSSLTVLGNSLVSLPCVTSVLRRTSVNFADNGGPCHGCRTGSACLQRSVLEPTRLPPVVWRTWPSLAEACPSQESLLYRP